MAKILKAEHQFVEAVVTNFTGFFNAEVHKGVNITNEARVKLGLKENIDWDTKEVRENTWVAPAKDYNTGAALAYDQLALQFQVRPKAPIDATEAELAVYNKIKSYHPVTLYIKNIERNPSNEGLCLYVNELNDLNWFDGDPIETPGKFRTTHPETGASLKIRRALDGEDKVIKFINNIFGIVGGYTLDLSKAFKNTKEIDEFLKENETNDITLFAACKVKTMDSGATYLNQNVLGIAGKRAINSRLTWSEKNGYNNLKYKGKNLMIVDPATFSEQEKGAIPTNNEADDLPF